MNVSEWDCVEALQALQELGEEMQKMEIKRAPLHYSDDPYGLVKVYQMASKRIVQKLTRCQRAGYAVEYKKEN